MKFGALVLVSVVLLAGCGGNSNAAGSSSPSSSAPLLTLDQVASAACGDLIYHVEHGGLDWFASQGATCGKTEVSIFDSPGARDNWTSIAAKNGRALVGANWSVTPANDAVLKRAQAALGGKVVGGF